MRIQLTRLLRGVEIESENKLPRMDLADYHDSPAHIAKLLRGIWNLPSGPIQNLTQTIESAGGIVFRCSFGTGKVDAISQWLPGLPPLFFVNSDIPGDRLRYTLAHELGHLIMHQIPTVNLEVEANRFAAELLMPEKDIKPHLGSLSIQKLAAMKPYWKVAMSALLKRAFELGKVTASQYRKLNTQISKYGFKTSEPIPISIEEPTVLKDIISVYRNEHSYTIPELTKLLVCNEHDFRIRYLPDFFSSRLRAIK
jgi:Zn-dependent peptidase ImmA (M78 family)